MMKKLLILLIFILSISTSCNKCNDCGALPVRQYGLINNIDQLVTIELKGDDMFTIQLQANDTSQLWEAIIDPRTCCCEKTYFSKNRLENSFPFIVDEISLKVGVQTPLIFERCIPDDACNFSIFRPNYFGDNHTDYFKIDSISLCLE